MNRPESVKTPSNIILHDGEDENEDEIFLVEEAPKAPLDLLQVWNLLLLSILCPYRKVLGLTLFESVLFLIIYLSIIINNQ